MLYDKNRRPILEADILKVYHFTGARNKRHYMYKQAGKVNLFGKENVPYLKISHLDQSVDGHYHEKYDGRVLTDYEIIQGYPYFGDREKLK